MATTSNVYRKAKTIAPLGSVKDVPKVANMGGLMKQAFPTKLNKDARGRLIDPRTGERVHYVIHVVNGAVKIRTPGDVFKMKCGKSYCVQPNGELRS
jgi:hypothetical protein